MKLSNLEVLVSSLSGLATGVVMAGSVLLLCEPMLAVSAAVGSAAGAYAGLDSVVIGLAVVGGVSAAGGAASFATAGFVLGGLVTGYLANKPKDNVKAMLGWYLGSAAEGAATAFGTYYSLK